MRRNLLRSLALVLLLFGAGGAAQQHPCSAIPGVAIIHGEARFAAGDMNYVSFVVPPEQKLPGLDWQLFLNQRFSMQSFSYPPGWQPNILPTDFSSNGIRLLSPDGSAAYEAFTTLLTTPVSARQVAEFGIQQLIGANAPATILCADEFALPIPGASQAIVAVSSGANTVVSSGVMNNSYNGIGATYIVLGGPSANLEALIRNVFLRVTASFPRSGGGGDNDRDGDGYNDDVDDYPDDPNRH